MSNSQELQHYWGSINTREAAQFGNQIELGERTAFFTLMQESIYASKLKGVGFGKTIGGAAPASHNLMEAIRIHSERQQMLQNPEQPVLSLNHFFASTVDQMYMAQGIKHDTSNLPVNTYMYPYPMRKDGAFLPYEQAYMIYGHSAVAESNRNALLAAADKGPVLTVANYWLAIGHFQDVIRTLPHNLQDRIHLVADAHMVPSEIDDPLAQEYTAARQAIERTYLQTADLINFPHRKELEYVLANFPKLYPEDPRLTAESLAARAISVPRVVDMPTFTTDPDEVARIQTDYQKMLTENGAPKMDPQAPKVVNIGRVHQERKTEDTVKAWIALAERCSHIDDVPELHLLGAMSDTNPEDWKAEFNELIQSVQEKGLGSKLFYPGQPINTGEVLSVMANLQQKGTRIVTLNTPKAEGFGMSAQEYAMAGLPRVMTKATGLIGTNPENSALFADIGDIDGLADQMELAITDKTGYVDAVTQAGYENSQLYSSEAVASSFMNQVEEKTHFFSK